MKYTRNDIEKLSRDELEQIVKKSTSKEEILSITANAPINIKNDIKITASENRHTPLEALKAWRKSATDFDTYNLMNQAICERTHTPCRHGDDDDPDPYAGWQSMIK